MLKDGNNSFGDLANLIDSAESGSTIVLDKIILMMMTMIMME